MDDRGQGPTEGYSQVYGGLEDLVNLEGFGDGNTSAVPQGSIPTHPRPSATQTIRPENVVLGGSSVPQPPSATQTVRFEFGSTSVPQPPSATTVRPGNVVLGGSSVAHLPVSAAQTVQRGRRKQTRMPIKVAMKGRRAYRFHVDPNGKVAGLRALLVNRTDDLPLDYGFVFNRDYLNEDVSFQTQGMVVVGARDPKIEVVDFSANFQLRNI